MTPGVIDPALTGKTLTEEALQVLARYGLGAVISLGLIWWLTMTVAGEVRTMHAQLEEHIRISSFFSRQICINTARDDLQRFACEPAAR